jgi:hypothetical protein
MPRLWMPSFLLVLAAAASVQLGAVDPADDPKSGVPDVPDLTIKTEERVDQPHSTVLTSVLYFKGPWQRRELHVRFPSTVPAQRTMRHTAITRCDERRRLDVNDEARIYASWPVDVIGRDLFVVRPWWRHRSEPRPTGAEVKIIVNTVDTGERRQVGRYSARHVITTTTTDPSPGANTPAGESVTDGWYIDLPPAGCQDAGEHVFFASGSVVRPGAAPDRVTTEFHGTGRRGFAIEETTRSRGERQTQITTSVKLIEFSNALLNKSLFDVPAGYRPAVPRLIGGFDMTKPDTIANRLEGYWQDVTTLARDFFRF